MSRDRHLLAVGLVAAAALAAFATALHGSFVNWDDEWLILRNPFLRNPGRIGEILDPLGERILLGAEYLPVRDLSNLVDFRFFGTEPTGYRLGNWLLHALGAALAYAFLLEALRLPRAALAGALLWAVHPLHAEAVSWASARKDLLCAVFALLAATLHLRAGRTGSRALGAAAAGAFLLATLSKTAAAALPVALAAWEVLSGDGAVPAARRALAAARRAAPMLLVAAAGAALHSLHQERGNVVAGWRGGGWLPNLFLMAGVHLRYLRQAVLPFGLAPDYALDAARPDAPANLAGLAAGAAALAGSVLLLRRRSPAGLGALWWFALLLPVSNLVVPITNVSADRYLHLPLLGPCLLAGLAFDRACAAGRERLARGALAAVAAALGAAAALQCLHWRDGVALWTRAVEVSPGSGRAWMNRGEALAFAGRREEALDSFRRMLEAEPENANYWAHAANRLLELAGPAHLAEAEGLVRNAVARAKPDNGLPFVVLGWVLHRRGRVEESVRMLEEAVRRQPDLAEAHYNLGLWHEVGRRTSRAVESLETAVRLGLALDREVDARDRLARLWGDLGDEERARAHRVERERKRALSFGE
jgi:tetratricopeptide (TPR) repeat protein